MAATECGRVVYILGAGVNQGTRNWNGLTPPMAKDVFAKAKAFEGWGLLRGEDLTNLFKLVEKVSGVTRDRIGEFPIDWEDCYTAALQKQKEAAEAGDHAAAKTYWTVSVQLIRIIAQVLEHFHTGGEVGETTEQLTDIIREQGASVLTFNYDCFIEENLESRSGFNSGWLAHQVRTISPDEATRAAAASARWNPRRTVWSRNVGYHVPFDLVPVEVGVGGRDLVAGSDFYGDPTNGFVEPCLLKLHGSTNWFRYTRQPAFPSPPFPEPPVSALADRSLILEGQWWSSNYRWPNVDGLYLEPLILAGKDKAERRTERPFNLLWEEAAKRLEACTRLVAIGYSFSDDDIAKWIGSHLHQDQLDQVQIVLPSSVRVDEVCDKLGIDRCGLDFPTVDQFVWRHPLVVRKDPSCRFYQEPA